MPEQPLILIVDDEPDFLEIFGIKLSSEGFRVATASGGAECIEKAQRLHPDLILMDVKMPGMSGPDVVLKLKENRDTKDAKIVFLTNLGDPSAEGQTMNDRFSREFGVKGYVRKTDDLDSIADKVLGFLRQE